MESENNFDAHIIHLLLFKVISKQQINVQSVFCIHTNIKWIGILILLCQALTVPCMDVTHLERSMELGYLVFRQKMMIIANHGGKS